MRRTMSGEKRARDTRDQETDNEDFKFISGLSLSQHPVVQQWHLFMKKFNSIVKTKSLHPKDFEGYTIRERFEKMGWEQLLSFNCEKIYKRVVIQWTSSLSRNGDELTGIVDGKSYTITPAIIRDSLKVDTRTDLPYSRFSEADFQTITDETNRRWNEACKTVFGLIENVKKGFGGYQRFKMTPLAQILWRIGVCTFHPRLEDMNCVLAREIYLLHSLFTGEYLYSFAHLMIDDIWDMYEDKNRQNIPHGSYISEILKQYGAVSEHEYSETVPPQHRIISRSSFVDLKFSESATEYILDDRVTEQRVTFPKKVIHEDTPPPFPRHWMPMPNPYMDITQLLTNLQTIGDKQSSESQKQHNELVLMVRNIALEAERREQERDKQAKERERLAEKKEQEREKRAEMKEQEREKHAEEKEQEREKRAEEREQERENRAEEKEQEREKRSEEKEQERQKRADEREQERQKRAAEKEQEREKRVEQKEQEREKRAEEREQEREKRAEKKELEIEKRAEKKELERQIRAEEKEKLTEDKEQDRVRQAEEREKQAKERERKAEERVKQAEGREHERDRVAEERERQAEIRAHAIIWDIERQRYFYEQDQEQLRMSWNQVNVVNEVNEFQFPQISHTSFHPPPEGSRYYDPTHANEIPKAFQSLYHDIFGPKPLEPTRNSCSL